MSKLPVVKMRDDSIISSTTTNFWGNIPGWVLLSDYQPNGLVGRSPAYVILMEGIRMGKIKSLTCNKSSRQAVLKTEADEYIAANQKPKKPEPTEGLGNVFADMPGWVQLSSYDNRMNKMSGPKTKEYKTLAKAIVRGELACVHHSRSKKVGVNKEAADAFLQKKLYSKYEVAKQHIEPEVKAKNVFDERYFALLREISKMRSVCFNVIEDLKYSFDQLEKVLKEGEKNATDKVAEATVLRK